MHTSTSFNTVFQYIFAWSIFSIFGHTTNKILGDQQYLTSSSQAGGGAPAAADHGSVVTVSLLYKCPHCGVVDAQRSQELASWMWMPPRVSTPLSTQLSCWHGMPPSHMAVTTVAVPDTAAKLPLYPGYAANELT